MTAALVAPHDGVMADDPAARPRRRRFSPEYKLAILAEYDRLTEPGDKGALLRREGLYTSHIVEWRRARDAGALSGLAAQAHRPRRTPEQVELERVRRRNQRLEPSWPAPRPRWRSWEKHTRSWSSSPRARTASRGPAGDRRHVGRVGGPGADQAGVGTARRAPREPVPASPGRGTDPPSAAGSAQRAHPSRAAATVGRAARAAVLRPATRPGLGPAAGRGDLPGLDLDHVPAVARHGESRDRRRQRTHPARVKPQLLARKPNDVWSWDITKLPGPSRHEFYDLYVILDLYSRYAPGWLVAPGESAELAESLIASTIASVGVAPGVIHADRGSSMTSKPVAQLLVDLGVVRSHSRPHVSDDNPIPRPSSRRSSTARRSPSGSGRSTTPASSARHSWTPTTTSIVTPRSGCTRRRRSTTAPLPRSEPTARPCSIGPTRPTRSGSPARRPRPGCPPSPGSTSPPRRRSYRRDDRQVSHRP